MKVMLSRTRFGGPLRVSVGGRSIAQPLGSSVWGVLVEQVVFHGLSGTGLNTWFMAC